MKKARRISKALRPAGLKIKVKTGIKAGAFTQFR